MKKLAMAALAVMVLILAGCGSNSHSEGNINGLWAATLNSSGSETLAFSTVLTVHSDGTLGSNSFGLYGEQHFVYFFPQRRKADPLRSWETSMVRCREISNTSSRAPALR